MTPPIINFNNINYKNNEVSFKTSDILLEDLPKSYDLVIIRDLFIHLKNDEILKDCDDKIEQLLKQIKTCMFCRL